MVILPSGLPFQAFLSFREFFMKLRGRANNCCSYGKEQPWKNNKSEPLQLKKNIYIIQQMLKKPPNLNLSCGKEQEANKAKDGVFNFFLILNLSRQAF